MKNIPQDFLDHLNTGLTTIAWCWRIIREDGAILGFTNHDLLISFDGTDFMADSGMSGSELQETLGLGVDNMDIAGAITSDQLTEFDISSGKYDHALIELYAVNWTDPVQRYLIKRGRLGEVTRGVVHFEAELRGLAAEIQQEVGRLYQFTCDAILGDSHCGIDLTDPAYLGNGAVVSSSGNNLELSGIDSFEDGWFTHGILEFMSGLNLGKKLEIKRSTKTGVILWSAPPLAVALGDTIEVVAGCDRTYATCKAKFANGVNFRGFPHMPSDEIVIQYPNTGDPSLDGGGRFNDGS